MSKVKIWGRELNIKFIYECKMNEEPTTKQKEAFSMFSEKILKDDAIIKPDRVIVFCEKNNKDELNNKKIDNIFKYVMPKEVIIDRNDKDRVLSLVCNYKFDLDSSLVIRFKNEVLISIYVDDGE